MQISGFPRSCSSLLLLLIAGSCTNKKVRYTSEGVFPGVICKDPFAIIRMNKGDLILVRHPMAVITSTSHQRSDGKYGFHWGKAKRLSPYSLREHYEAIGDRGVWKAEDLTEDPDAFQDRVSSEFGLEFKRLWSTWPWDDFVVPEYWLQSLGKIRPIVRCRDWDGEERIDVFNKHKDLRDAITSLGY